MPLYIISRREKKVNFSVPHDQRCAGAPTSLRVSNINMGHTTQDTAIGGGGGPSGGVLLLHVKNAQHFREGKAYHNHSHSQSTDQCDATRAGPVTGYNDRRFIPLS
jgi:hypothetical protein